MVPGKVAEVVQSSMGQGPLCYRCAKAGHVAKECKEYLFCINCVRENVHLSDKCPMVNRVSPVAKLVGCAAEDLQLPVPQSGKKSEEGTT